MFYLVDLVSNSLSAAQVVWLLKDTQTAAHIAVTKAE